MLLKSYDEARLLWSAKGWTIEGVAGVIASKPELADYKLAAATLQRYSVTSRRIPAPIATLIEELETRPKYARLVEIVETGLRVVRGQPTSTGRDPRELGRALIAHFPYDELARKLGDALVGQGGPASGMGALVDQVAALIASRLPHALKLREKKLAGHLGKRLDRLSAKRVALAGAMGGLAGVIGGGAMLLLGAGGLAGLLLTGRIQVVEAEKGGRASAQVAAEPARAAAAAQEINAAAATVTYQPVLIMMNTAEGGTYGVFDPQSLLGAVLGMGEKVVDQRIPGKPLPNQKVPPCLKEAGEVAIDGGCWFGSSDMKPPCGRYLFRGGDKCYRPVAADPQKPVGVITEEPRTEQRAR